MFLNARKTTILLYSEIVKTTILRNSYNSDLNCNFGKLPADTCTNKMISLNMHFILNGQPSLNPLESRNFCFND